MIKRLLLLSTLLCFCSAQAQEKEYMYEVGPGLGASWAYGDINRSSALYSPSLAADILFRYNINLRWALAFDISTLRLQGDSKDFSNAFPNQAHWSFDRRCWQLGFRPEFSFWNYGFGADFREKHRFAPFLTAGCGVGYVTGSSSQSDKSTTILTLPIGLGLKWKMSPRWDLSYTCLWSKCFGDDMDGIVDPYQTGTKSPVNTDWIGSMMLNITFSFGERCLECHNQNE